MVIDFPTLQAKALAALPDVLIAIGILLAGYIAAKSSRRILKWVKKVVADKTESEFDDMILDALRKPTRYVIYAIAVTLSLERLGVNARNEITAVLILFLVRPISELIDAILKKIEKDYIRQTKSMLDDTVFPLLNKTIIFSAYILAVIIVLDLLGINVLTFIAGLGIAGLAIGLAAKDTLANVIAGIFIIIDRPFVVGDRIEVWSAPKQSATWGDVEEIGLRSTKIRTTDNILLIIPNSEISRRDVINYTAKSPDIRVRVPVGIAYDADREKAEKIMLDIADKTEGVKKDPAPKVVMLAFGQSSVDLELRAWIENAKKRRDITSSLAKQIKTEFDRQKIEIPFPRRYVIIKKED